MNESEKLYNMLKSVQEPKGYYFSNDRGRVFELLDALLLNKEKHGYMCCPCRLSSGDRKRDQDIICPCVYREEDVKEYGSCYCNLYVTKDWNEGKVDHTYVPERRPAEMMF